MFSNNFDNKKPQADRLAVFCVLHTAFVLAQGK